MTNAEVATKSRTPDEIVADLDRARARLASDVEGLRDYFAPTAIVRRGSERVTGWFLDDFGGIRPDRVAIAVAPVAAVGVLGALIRRRRGR